MHGNESVNHRVFLNIGGWQVSYWVFVGLVLAAIAVALLLPHYRLKKALNAPFPDEWVEIVERNIAVYPKLPMDLRVQLRQLIKQFLHQKHFSGAGGLEINDEIRVTIAAEACMLLVNRKTNVYPSLRYIIVYPAAFVVDRPQGGADGIVSEGRKGLLGESWSNGKVILAWDNVLHGSRNFVDGQNVVLHEFAHQLDSESGSTNGAPILAGNNCQRNSANSRKRPGKVKDHSLTITAPPTRRSSLPSLPKRFLKSRRRWQSTTPSCSKF